MMHQILTDKSTCTLAIQMYRSYSDISSHSWRNIFASRFMSSNLADVDGLFQGIKILRHKYSGRDFKP